MTSLSPVVQEPIHDWRILKNNVVNVTVHLKGKIGKKD